MRARTIALILILAVAVISAAVYFGYVLPNSRAHSANSSVAPEFTVTDIYGHPFSLSQYRNNSVVVIEFTSLSCSECQIVEKTL